MECAYYFGGRHMGFAYYFGGRHMGFAYFSLVRLIHSSIDKPVNMNVVVQAFDLNIA
jgi:hypothetical protein